MGGEFLFLASAKIIASASNVVLPAFLSPDDGFNKFKNEFSDWSAFFAILLISRHWTPKKLSFGIGSSFLLFTENFNN